MDINPLLFPAITNRESWTQTMSINDADTGDPVDLSAVTFQLEVRRFRHGHGGGGYGTSYSAVGEYDGGGGPVITASLGDGITVIDLGVFQVYLPESKIRSLPPDTYSVACTISDGDDTRQLFLGRLPVLAGMVTY